MLLQHLDGLSFRSLAYQWHLSAYTTYYHCLTALKALPHCADVTRRYCSRFCGILLVDGKYVKVKGYDHKIPVLYGIDYLTHDIPYYLLSRAENYQTCLKFFNRLRLLNYPLQALICDDNINLYQACSYVYPKAVIQLCQNHYKENIRRQLQVGTDPKYQPFMQAIESLFATKRSREDLEKRARGILSTFNQDPICVSILADIYKRQTELFGYHNLKGIPITTNLIECFNSHLQGRLKTIKGFESTYHTNLWLNGYILRRRTKKFTDCSDKFKYLNGKTSLEKSLNPNLELPSFF